MKTLWKVVKIFFGGIGALILLGSVSVFIYHHYQLNKEAALLKEKGTVVDVDGKRMNMYQEGSGKDTFVFMSGSGVAAPAYEMKGLYSKFSKENKIAVVDRAGYGYSDVYNDDRDIDTILEQTRKALLQSGNKPPYIFPYQELKRCIGRRNILRKSRPLLRWTLDCLSSMSRIN